MLSNNFHRQLTIRRAGAEDCDFITHSIGTLTQLVMNTKKMPINIGIKEAYHEMMKSPERYPMFVAEEKDKNNKIIKLGAAVTSAQIMLHMGGPYIYVQELIVDETARGKGVGAALLKHIEEYANEKGYFSIELCQPPKETKYHEERTKFYTNQGFDLCGVSRSKDLRKWIKIVD